MEYPPDTLPAVPPGGVTCGIDWANDDHAVCVVDLAGKIVQRFTVEHTGEGLAGLVRRLRRSGVGEVAIERPDGKVVDTLLEAGLTIVVISPNQLKNLRGRYGSAGNKDDRFDAFVLADTLRTDRARLRPLLPDSPATVTLRQTCRARKDLVGHRVAVCNQLRAHLKIAFPGAAGLFRELDSPISLAFLARFDCQDRADWLSPRRLAAWLQSQGYSGRKDPAELHARLAAAPRGATGDDGAAQAHITGALLAVLTSLVQQIKALEAQIAEQLALHADAHIFTSLPRSGTVRAARLLAEIGDCRARFPTPEALICLAGVAPSTRKSGKTTFVDFRWAADKQLRDAVCDFAGDSRHASPWAARLYNDAIARGKDHPHATRILARAWLYIIWHCWQHHTAYDPARHKALQRILAEENPAAA
jgi:transposase